MNHALNPLIVHSPFFSDLSSEDLSFLSQSHADLLPSCFNLLNTPMTNGSLLLKATSLSALMRFYDHLIKEGSFMACEIVFSSNSYYGLLAGEKKDLAPPSGIETQWFAPGQSLANIYNS